MDSQDLTTRPGIFDRARTAAFVPWLGSIGDLVIDDWNDSPDITSIIEELIALHGGDMDAENVGLMFWGRTDASMGGTFKTADFDPQFACKLRIAYSVPVVVNPPVLSDESAVLTEGEPYPDFGVANTGDPVDTWEDLDNLGSVPGFEWNGDGTYSVDELAIQEATEQVYRVRATNAGGSDIGNLSVTVLPGAPALHVEYQNQPYLFQAGVPGFFDVTIISGTFDACDWKAGGPALPNGVTLQKVAPNLGRISYDGT